MSSVITNRNLAYWKEGYVTMRDLAEKAIGKAKEEWEIAAEYAQEHIHQIEAKVLVCIVLLVLVGGCNTLHGVLKDGSWLLKQGAENTEVQEEQK